MMRVMIADGLGAQQYGKMGNGNIPDPTSRAAFKVKQVPAADGRVYDVVVWRDHRPEQDLADQQADRELVAKALERMDRVLRQWPAAGVALLLVTIALGAAVFTR